MPGLAADLGMLGELTSLLVPSLHFSRRGGIQEEVGSGRRHRRVSEQRKLLVMLIPLHPSLLLPAPPWGEAAALPSPELPAAHGVVFGKPGAGLCLEGSSRNA